MVEAITAATMVGITEVTTVAITAVTMADTTVVIMVADTTRITVTGTDIITRMRAGSGMGSGTPTEWAPVGAGRTIMTNIFGSAPDLVRMQSDPD